MEQTLLKINIVENHVFSTCFPRVFRADGRECEMQEAEGEKDGEPSIEAREAELAPLHKKEEGEI